VIVIAEREPPEGDLVNLRISLWHFPPARDPPALSGPLRKETPVSVTRTEIPVDELRDVVARILKEVGVPDQPAKTVAESLVDADLEGVSSHGVLLLPLYVSRIQAGSVAPDAELTTVIDSDAVTVLDAGHGLGQPSGDRAMEMAIAKAQSFGLGLAAVRRAFHFGMTRRYTLRAASLGLIGVAMCNTRPLMPAPGGAERLVGNNPMSIALPVAGETPLVLDMAMSEAAMGKIRMAAQAGGTIPESWATDSRGVPTSDPAEAIEGMLLPMGGHKGFGLAFMIDLLCGLLSGGSWGSHVQPLYGDPSVPYDCSHLFAAIDVSRFRPVGEFEDSAAVAAQRVRDSVTAPGVHRLYSSGEAGWRRRLASGSEVTLDPSVLGSLIECAQSVGVEVDSLSRYEEGNDHG